MRASSTRGCSLLARRFLSPHRLPSFRHRVFQNKLYPILSTCPRCPSLFSDYRTVGSSTAATTSSRGFASSTTFTAWDDAETLFDFVKDTRKKWGFVVYRTTYLNDQEWNNVKEVIIQRMTSDALESSVPDVLNYMEWTFVDDKNSLDGASRASLRQRFRAWAAVAAREEGGDLEKYYANPRYFIFLEIDQASLQSIIGDERGFGHVNLVNSRWEPGMLEYDDEQHRLGWLEDEKSREPIDDCREEDVGWMKIEALNLNLDFPVQLEKYVVDDGWGRLYRRPPQVRPYL